MIFPDTGDSFGGLILRSQVGVVDPLLKVQRFQSLLFQGFRFPILNCPCCFLKSCQTMSVRGHCLTSSFCSRKNVATTWNHRLPWRIGAGFIYHSCSFFQFLTVRVASSNPAPMSTIFFPSALYCSA